MCLSQGVTTFQVIQPKILIQLPFSEELTLELSTHFTILLSLCDKQFPQVGRKYVDKTTSQRESLNQASKSRRKQWILDFMRDSAIILQRILINSPVRPHPNSCRAHLQDTVSERRLKKNSLPSWARRAVWLNRAALKTNQLSANFLFSLSISYRVQPPTWYWILVFWCMLSSGFRELHVGLTILWLEILCHFQYPRVLFPSYHISKMRNLWILLLYLTLGELYTNAEIVCIVVGWCLCKLKCCEL